MAQDLEAAYGLETPQDNLDLYRAWAETYDSGFARDMRYELPLHVAEAFRAAGGDGPVIDLGAGTGLCGVALAALGIGPVDACDLSAEMLAVASEKGTYNKLFTGNLLARLPVEDDVYGGAVSSGTFTHGHVGPEALHEVLRIVKPGGIVALSVNAEHWEARGFADAVAQLPATGVALRDVRIYGEGASGPHADDMSRVLTMQKA